MKRGFAACSSFSPKVVGNDTGLRFRVDVRAVVDKQLHEFGAVVSAVTSKGVMEWCFKGFIATTIRLRTVFEQQANAVELIHVGETSKNRRSVFIVLSVRISAVGQEIINHRWMKRKERASTICVGCVDVSTRVDQGPNGIDVAGRRRMKQVWGEAMSFVIASAV